MAVNAFVLRLIESLPMSRMPKALSVQDNADLLLAYQHLEYPSFAARLSSVVGVPIEMALKLLPKAWYRGLHAGVESAIEKSLDVAISSLRDRSPDVAPQDHYHKVLGVLSGAVGGFLGGPALLLELPVTTTIMLRTIADIGRAEGENLDTLDARLACLQVFAFGGRSKEDDAADTGYYGIRMALESSISNAARFVAGQGLNTRSGAPALIGLIGKISQRFGVVVSEKAAAELIPIIGAIGGAFVNSVFIQHFQDMAWSHFTIRRLERKYTPLLIQAEYEKLRKDRKKAL
jgi:hypothetical protein